LPVKAEGATQEPSHQRASHTEQHRHHDAAGVLARHEQLRQRPGDETNDECPQDMHVRPSFPLGEKLRWDEVKARGPRCVDRRNTRSPAPLNTVSRRPSVSWLKRHFCVAREIWRVLLYERTGATSSGISVA